MPRLWRGGEVGWVGGAAFSEERNRTVRPGLALKPQGVTKRRALDDFVEPLVVSRQFHTQREVGTSCDQQLNHR